MEEIAKMIGYCVMGLGLLTTLILVIAIIVYTSGLLLATPVGIVGFVIIVAVIIKKLPIGRH